MMIKPQASLEQPAAIGEDDDTDADEALDDAAQGQGATSDEQADGTGEIDGMGAAAGLVAADGKPFRGIDEVDRRDERRWELDPASAEHQPTAK